MGEKNNAHRNLAGKPEERDYVGDVGIGDTQY
jgi:hypothetical protein